MKIRRMDKKAQEAVQNFGVTGIILIVFLVVVVLGIWYVNSRSQPIIEEFPKNAEVIAQSCNAYAKEATMNTYCFDFKEVIKDKIYSTCDYVQNYNILVLDSDGTNTSAIKMNKLCKENEITQKDTIIFACNDSNGKFFEKPKIIVNGKKCSEWIISSE